MNLHAIRIGTSGWSYAQWHGPFYPVDLKAREQFQYYAKYFNTVEINSTFYALPKRQTFINWKNNSPPGFIFVLKASSLITHIKRLQDTDDEVALFIENARLLGEKLGAVLFQLPPGMKCDHNLLENFLKLLPVDLRYVFEFRNPGWYNQAVYELLLQHNCAFCIYDLAGHQSPVEITADFIYIRLHGPGKKYQGSYTDKALDRLATYIKSWAQSRDVFVYFDNDQKAYAVFNAMRLMELIG